MSYERICDVPRDMPVMIQHRVRGIHDEKKKFRTFQFEMPYGADPRYWKQWRANGYLYYDRLPMEHSFRVVE